MTGRRGSMAVVRVNVQVGPDRVPVLEVCLPGSASLGDLRREIARHFRIPADYLELVREVTVECASNVTVFVQTVGSVSLP